MSNFNIIKKKITTLKIKHFQTKKRLKKIYSYLKKKIDYFNSKIYNFFLVGMKKF